MILGGSSFAIDTRVKTAVLPWDSVTCVVTTGKGDISLDEKKKTGYLGTKVARGIGSCVLLRVVCVSVCVCLAAASRQTRTHRLHGHEY